MLERVLKFLLNITKWMKYLQNKVSSERYLQCMFRDFDGKKRWKNVHLLLLTCNKKNVSFLNVDV
jgi:hypothetical protein